jgi:glycerol-3-phosphate cytidylyltransferase
MQETKLTIYTGGTFDLFHSGHVNLLKSCSQLGRVVVALNTDEFIEQYKGQKPIMDYQQRKETLQACRYVWKVVPNEGGSDSTLTITKVNPNVIAIGSDWARKDYYSQMGFTQDWLDARGYSLIYIPYTGGISTTKLKAKIRQGLPQ